jgi:putative transposase
VKYSFITQHKNAYPVTLQCQVLGVSRNGYYQYERNQANKPKDPEHQEMLEWVEDIAESSGYTYGCVFQTNPATDSIAKLPPIPRQSCH